jgi:hypothetical protein
MAKGLRWQHMRLGKQSVFESLLSFGFHVTPSLRQDFADALIIFCLMLFNFCLISTSPWLEIHLSL